MADADIDAESQYLQYGSDFLSDDESPEDAFVEDLCVRFIVPEAGPRATVWVYQSEIMQHCPRLMQVSWLLDARSPVIEFPGWRPETINSVAIWLRTGHVKVRGVSFSGQIDPEFALTYDPEPYHDGSGYRLPWYASYSNNGIAHCLCRVVDVYHFAMVVASVPLAVDCILFWQRQLCPGYAIRCNPSMMRAVLDTCGSAEHPLFDFLIDMVAFDMTEETWHMGNWANLPPVVLSKIMRYVALRANFGIDTNPNSRRLDGDFKDGVPDPNLDWCRHHGHTSEAQRDACRARRPQDWDIRREAALQRAATEAAIRRRAVATQQQPANRRRAAPKKQPAKARGAVTKREPAKRRPTAVKKEPVKKEPVKRRAAATKKEPAKNARVVVKKEEQEKSPRVAVKKEPATRRRAVIKQED